MTIAELIDFTASHKVVWVKLEELCSEEEVVFILRGTKILFSHDGVDFDSHLSLTWDGINFDESPSFELIALREAIHENTRKEKGLITDRNRSWVDKKYHDN